MRPLLLWVLAGGCGGLDEAKVPEAEGDFAGPEDGGVVQLAPSIEPTATPMTLRMEAESWEMRRGERWADAEELAEYEVEREDGLWVDGVQLLPATVEIGAACEHCEVVELGETETRYGLFLDTVTVEIDEGDFEGEAVFARDIGPIVLEWDGSDWEAVYYE